MKTTVILFQMQAYGIAHIKGAWNNVQAARFHWPLFPKCLCLLKTGRGVTGHLEGKEATRKHQAAWTSTESLSQSPMEHFAQELAGGGTGMRAKKRFPGWLMINELPLLMEGSHRAPNLCLDSCIMQGLHTDQQPASSACHYFTSIQVS